ncbi:MAG TPA: nucleoside hydrolase [Acidimicrobiales bacterium]|nr:nucleoside hydrolase [Acidimicrobiales bacterium]
MTDGARRIVIDTDPGIDDATAIAVALASPELDVVGLTSVFGNHDVEVTTANAQRVLDQLGQPDRPVVRGAARPLVRPFHGPATIVHGADGLGDAGFPPPSRPPLAGRQAAEWIVRTVLDRPGEVTLVALGPLTNLALALHLEPGIVDAVAEVVVMGGAAFVSGNVTPTAEANIWNDPEAAELVLAAGWPLTLVGLDVTEQLFADTAWLRSLDDEPAPGARLTALTAPCYERYHARADGLAGIHCHDVATIAWLLDPGAFAVEPRPVRVVTDGFAAGQTVVPSRRGADAADWDARPTVQVALGVDAPRVLDLVRTRLVAPPIPGSPPPQR